MLAYISDVKKSYDNFKMDAYLMIHRAMVKDITNLTTASRRLPGMSFEETARLNTWFQFFWEMVEIHHKEEDDYFFNEILEKAPNFKLALDKLNADHQELDHLVDQIGQGLSRLQKVEPGPERVQISNTLSEVLATFRDLLVDHLEREEAAVVPSIAANFTPREQKLSSDNTLKRMPMKHMSKVVPWVTSALNEEETRQGLKQIPVPARILYHLAWKKNYAKFAEVLQTRA